MKLSSINHILKTFHFPTSIRCAALLLLTLITYSCKKDNQENSKNNIVKAKIEDATLLFSVESSKENSPNLYKQKNNGDIEPVYFIKENGDSITMNITAYHNLTEDYILLSGSFTLKEGWFSNVLVNTKNENIYALPSAPPYGIYGSPIEIDREGNLYFASDQSMVYKINTTNLDKFQIEEYLPKDQKFSNFMVNPHGICFYGNGNTNALDDKKLKLPSGQIVPFKNLIDFSEDTFINYNDVVIGPDGDYYFAIQTPSWTSGIYSLYQVQFNNEQPKTSFVTEVNINYSGGIYFRRNKIKDTFFTYSHSSKDILEFDKSNKKFKSYPKDLPNGTYGNEFFTKDYWLITPLNQDGTKITKVSLKDYNLDVVTVVPNEEYEIYDFKTSPYSNVVSFSGLRYSDGKNIIGTIEENNTISIEVVEQGKPINLIKLN